jgi:putative tryptophan/tyrosine transport system substrate-binding protein
LKVNSIACRRRHADGKRYRVDFGGLKVNSIACRRWWLTVRRRVVVIATPGLSAAETMLREVQKAARVIGWPVVVLKAGTRGEIDEAFAAMARGRAQALFVQPDGFLSSRRVPFATLAARSGIATASANREDIEAGGLMSYGTDIADMFRQVGAYTGQILKGIKPADLPVVQSTKFEFVINRQTARTLGIEVPPGILATADTVIE